MKNANKRFNPTCIRVNCRFSYCHLFEARKNSDDPSAKPKYDCMLLVPKSDEQAVKLINESLANATALYTEKFGKPKSKLKNTVKDGDDQYPDDANCAGMLCINVNSANKPGIKMLDPDLGMVDALDEDDFYSGCFGAAVINFAPYNIQAGNQSIFGIGTYIDNVIKLEDGEKLAGGGMSAEESFDDLM